jgi:hypothetical protein
MSQATPPRLPAKTPAPSEAAPPRERRAERDYFDDSVSDPVFPAVDEANVQVSPDVAVFDVEDKARALPEVLRKHNGFFAFGAAKDQGYATWMIRAADSSRVDLPFGLASLAEYRVFPITGDRYPPVDEIRRKYKIDPALNVYAVFSDAFDRVLFRQIRTAAAKSGRAGRVIAARFAFSTSDPTGIEVLQVRVRPPAAH